MSWRDAIKIHPAANLFPMMSDAELDALAADIKKAGRLTSPIVFLITGPESEDRLLLDGRNRIEAAERIGYKIKDQEVIGWCERHINPYEYVVSANIQRRHLTAEQKRDLIAKLLAAEPAKSDRQIAKTVGVHNETVAAVRKKAVAAGDVTDSVTRTDTRGRAQPARKPKPKTAPTPADDARVEADRQQVVALFEKVKAAEQAAKQAAKPRAAPSASDPKVTVAALNNTWNVLVAAEKMYALLCKAAEPSVKRAHQHWLASLEKASVEQSAEARKRENADAEGVA
jgi:hypothetical protein